MVQKSKIKLVYNSENIKCVDGRMKIDVVLIYKKKF